MDPATAILEGSATGKYWKKELLARGYEYKMAAGFPKEDASQKIVEWKFDIMKK